MRSLRFLFYTLLIVLIAICGSAHAQTTDTKQQVADSVFIDGRVIDEIREGMVAAVVELKVDSGTILGALTNEEGYFRLYHPPIAEKKLFLRVNYMAYKTITIPLDSFKKPFTIQMTLNKDYPIDGCGYYRIPLIDPWGPTQRSFTSEEIEKMAR